MQYLKFESYKRKVTGEKQTQNDRNKHPSVVCPVCELEEESVDHIFLVCRVAKECWKIMADWWTIQIKDFETLEEVFVWSGKAKRSLT